MVTEEYRQMAKDYIEWKKSYPTGLKSHWDYFVKQWQVKKKNKMKTIICNRCDEIFSEKEVSFKITNGVELAYSHKAGAGKDMYRIMKLILLPCGHYDTHWVKVESNNKTI